jgi:hypothetical protein
MILAQRATNLGQAQAKIPEGCVSVPTSPAEAFRPGVAPEVLDLDPVVFSDELEGLSDELITLATWHDDAGGFELSAEVAFPGLLGGELWVVSHFYPRSVSNF